MPEASHFCRLYSGFMESTSCSVNHQAFHFLQKKMPTSQMQKSEGVLTGAGKQVLDVLQQVFVEDIEEVGLWLPA